MCKVWGREGGVERGGWEWVAGGRVVRWERERGPGSGCHREMRPVEPGRPCERETLKRCERDGRTHTQGCADSRFASRCGLIRPVYSAAGR